MILQSLSDYYNRKSASDEGELPKEGWIRRAVDYVVVLDVEGTCLNIKPAGTFEKNKAVPREMLLPAIGKQALKHTNAGDDANLLWDNAGFIFGTGKKADKKVSSFLVAIDEWLGDTTDAGVVAVRSFILNVKSHPEIYPILLGRYGVLDDFNRRDPVISFQLISDVEGIHTRQAIISAYEEKMCSRLSSTTGTCLISGSETTPLVENETVIKNVWGGQPAGCNIVSFNKPSFCSYGKRGSKGKNAPIGVSSSFRYTTALNHLLSLERQRVQVGDASTVFWAEQPHDLETLVPDLFGEPPKDQPDQGADALRALYQSVESGRFHIGSDDTRFHVLGLAPNAARISIRFWETAPAAELARRLKRHFDDIAIAGGPNDPAHLSLFRLLVATAAQAKADNIPPNLGGDVVRSIIEDLPYPATLLNAAVQRCRAEQRVTYARAAALKACLNRMIRQASRSLSTSEKEFDVMLDPSHTSAAYRLGRLFAVLEKIQEEASPGLNATIRDRYYGAASSTPVAVFTTLLRLKNHHLGKLHAGRSVQMERLIGEIMEGLAEFPRVLPLVEQGRFALGYYHQRQALFTKQA